MSEVKVNKVSPRSGTGLQLGDSGDTITIPAGATLANSGTATGFAAIDWQSTIVTGATHTASANQGIWINTTSNACTLTLPGSPSVGDQLIFSDFARTWDTNAVTLSLNGSKFQGSTSPDPVYDTEGEAVHIVYSGSTKGWLPINDGGTAFETPQTYSASFLVIAGGGGGNQGGGGGGGYRESTQTVTVGNAITVTVGDGGTAGAGDSSGAAGNGSNSSISGTGLTTVTSAGGGAGGFNAGSDGGSGGGGGGTGESNPNPNAGGSGNTPSVSPAQGKDGGIGNGVPSQRTGAGGGGAGAVGGNGGTSGGTTGGNGGAGSASSITGSSVTRAGGGGGGNQNSGTSGSGGAGGGGAGARAATATAGTANTGGGGGGTLSGGSGAAGGKGVVIISVPTSDFSGTTTGSPTQTTSGSNTILQFNGTGSYTA
jgi:hypothetical protein